MMNRKYCENYNIVTCTCKYGFYFLRCEFKNMFYYLNINYIANHITGAFTDSLIPARENILARLSWKQYSYFSTNNEPFDRSTLASVTRNYFGPVNIKHLHIQIRDQYGRIISLNNMDFAMALNFTILYG